MNESNSEADVEIVINEDVNDVELAPEIINYLQKHSSLNSRLTTTNRKLHIYKHIQSLFCDKNNDYMIPFLEMNKSELDDKIFQYKKICVLVKN